MKWLPFSWLDLQQLNKKTIVVFVASTLCLVGIQFFGNVDKMPFLLSLIQGNHYPFYSFVYWALITIFFFAVVPLLVIHFVFHEKPSDYGLKTKQLFGYGKIYLIAFALIFPLLIVVSFSYQFQATYPFYVPPIEEFVPLYLIAEFLYVLTFFALEFFFRGFMVHGLKKEMGLYSVFVMTVPYCMIHFAKPLPECVGSIVAGIFLGLMSYKTNSVWMGAFLHSAVALSMNWLSLWQRGYFG
ncbi:MAG TPA: hypothetical protein DGG95_04020 [Cytophagales bacterium]|nr:hypothetical protein [Cytophagales bacterium]